MEVAKHKIFGSDYVGAFCISSDNYTIIPHRMKRTLITLIEETLKTECATTSLSDDHLLGIFGRANSNGIVLSNMVYDEELLKLKKSLSSIRVGRVNSDLNATGNNIITNDKIAFVNSDYTLNAIKEISDILGVEVLPMNIGKFKTVGASNILTNKGMAINNTVSDEEKESIEDIIKVKTTRTTANMGSLNIGISAVANSKGILTGDATTGFELARLIETLE